MITTWGPAVIASSSLPPHKNNYDDDHSWGTRNTGADKGFPQSSGRGFTVNAQWGFLIQSCVCSEASTCNLNYGPFAEITGGPDVGRI